MRIQLTNQSFMIPAGQAYSGIADCPRTLQIDDGNVWVTVEGSSQDYWLAAGDRLALEPGRLVVMEAGKADSKIALQPVAGDCHPFGIGHQLKERLAMLSRRMHLTTPAAVNNACQCS